MPLRPTYPLTTSRLRLRPLREDDKDELLAYHSSPEVHRYLPTGPMDASSILQNLESGPWSRTTIEAAHDALVLGVEVARSGQLVGDVMLAWVSRTHQCGEIGYVFSPRFAEHGFATEGVSEMLRLGFEELGLHRMIARIVEGNEPSLALAARLGMRQEAHLVGSWRRWQDGQWTDEIHLGILRSEWDVRAPRSDRAASQ
jgi:RimJ/RimL family protein N-acetyltransferase